ncbi:MAG: hypothetical protein JXR53_06225 [Bacteroidales bacterium]|nr:hypothetical protein [Bacteroidales bacterium]
MKKFVLMYAIILVLINTTSFAQDNKNTKFLSLELGGVGGLASFSYEWEFANTNNTSFFMRNAFSFVPIDKNNGVALIFPVMVHGVWGKGLHKVDFGIGQTITLTTKGKAFVLMPLSVGYKWQNPEQKHYWRIAYTPLISYLVDFQVQNWGGITYGYKF